MVKIGIIGGSGLEDPEILEEASEKEVENKYGKVNLIEGKIKGIDVVLLSRHGKKHTIPPSQVNFRANIQALKDAGCTHIIATTAVGSLKKEIEPGDFVILDQFIDFTKHRITTYYDEFEMGIPVHTSMAEPFDSKLREVFINSCKELGFKFHSNGTVVTIEGPRFSTRAESRMFKSWGADVINMSIAPEAILAKEAEIPYAAVAMSTDYDSWREGEEVSWEDVMDIFAKNIEKVVKLIVNAVQKVK